MAPNAVRDEVRPAERYVLEHDDDATFFVNPVVLVVGLLLVLLAAWALIWMPVSWSAA